MKIFLLIAAAFLFTNFAYGQKKQIAYCSNETSSGFLQVFVMDEDGSNKRQVSDIQENCMRPKWSPDGKQIVFYTDKGLIYLVRDASRTMVTDPFYLWSGYYPSFTPDGQVMFNNENEGVLSIFTIDTAAFNAEPEMLSDGSYSNMQVLSSSGDKLVYSTFEGSTKVIVEADLNDTTDSYLSQVSMNDEANLEPDVSPDGNQIVYASFDNNLKGTIRLFNNGKESALSKGLPSCNVPRFSPDGKKIAFVVIGENSVDLYTMNPDGSGRESINVPGSVGTFQWIDNDRILYDSGSDTKLSVGIVNVDTGSNEILAEGGFNLHPSIQK